MDSLPAGLWETAARSQTAVFWFGLGIATEGLKIWAESRSRVR